MKNILIVGASEEFLSNAVLEQVFENIKVNQVTLLVHHKEQAKQFERFGKCYFREDVAQGRYEDDMLDMQNSIPLDDVVFDYMAPYVLEILNQQRRFEEYHAFQISDTLENHRIIYMRNLFFWFNLLEREKITHVFFSCLPHEGYDHIIYHLAKMKNISIRMIYNSTLPRRYYELTDYLHPEKELGEVYHKLQEDYRDTKDIPLSQEEEKIYQKWSTLEPAKMKPWYMEGDPLKRRFEIRFGTTNIWSAVYQEIGNVYVKYNYRFCAKFVFDCIRNIPKFLKVMFKTAARWIRTRGVWIRTKQLNQFYDELAQMPIEGERYIYFALHYQPEASSNPLGGYYFDQLLAVNLLARSVGEDTKIYVKVHPEQLAPLRSKDYYTDMVKIPNVRLIKTKCDTYGLIRNAEAVSSLTGTVCWEAQFFGIPAILFGHSHKNLAPLSYAVRTYEECCDAVKEIREHKKTVSEKELRIFVKAMYEQSFAGEDKDIMLPQILGAFLAN
ncbi:MAG: hypothetical protein IJO65_01435 [Lachnospiraceae bacterium]|nr:hypothetical protein [Lachnospiraceae bacterium]